MKNISLIFVLFFTFCSGFSQISDEVKIKELLIKLSKTKIDTAQINILNDLAFCNRYIDAKKGLVYATKALSHSQKISYKRGISESYLSIGMCYTVQSDFEKAIPFLEKAIQTTIDQLVKAKAYTLLGIANTMKSNYAIALDYYYSALKIVEELKDEKRIATTLFNLGNVYSSLKDYQKANDYYIKSLKLDNDLDSAKDIYCNIGLNFISLKKYDKALLYFEKSLKLIKNNESGKAVKIYCLKGIGETYYYQNNLELARKYFLDAIELNKEINDNYILAESIRGIGNIYLDQGKNEKQVNKKNELLKNAISSYEKSLELSKQVSDFNNLSETYINLSEAENLLGNPKYALELFQNGTKLKDSIFNSENNETVKNLEDKRIIDLKNKELQINKMSIQKKSTLNKILIGSSIGLLLIGFLGYRNFRNKRKLQNLKISELEKDKQLFAIDTMLKTQEEERSRIAKDLHDGLGGLLSGTKLSFTNMKENLLLTPENAIQFEKSIGMLDTTIADLRKVAHNLMPEALVKFGLNDALNDFCSSIQLASNIKVDYQKIGLERKIGNTAETFIYRIIQELVNNAVKHAEATEILVQVAFTNNKIIVTVEDNGKGYDKNLASTGDGLDNIAYRIKYLSGTIDTVTSPNNGTSVNIELNV